MTNYQTNIAGKPELNTLVMNGNNEFVFNEKIHSLEYKMLDKSIILLRINDKNYTIEYELNDEEKENNEEENEPQIKIFQGYLLCFSQEGST